MVLVIDFIIWMFIFYFCIWFINEVLLQELCKWIVMCNKLVIVFGFCDFIIYYDNYYINYWELMNIVGYQNFCL